MQIRFIGSIHEVAAQDWNSLCDQAYPFDRHEFLASLEDSNCTTTETGWKVAHLLVFEREQLIAAMPGYVKTHSYGEYVFDWAWADAYRRYGLNYYPKWVNAIPFTPCTGPRLLTKIISPNLMAAISGALENHCRTNNYSGWHCLFPNTELSLLLAATGASQRIGCQFHWFNKNYQDFNDFVAQMASRKRKNILKERRLVQEQGFTFHIREAAQLRVEDMQFFYQLYRNTYLKRSGHAGYLTQDFFQTLAITFNANLVLVYAQKDGKNIAAALFFRDENTLYGRYWGCFDEYQFLHFETCYYQGIEYAIANKLQRFDGGAQGEHKIARGFEPVETYSNHYLLEPGFRPAIANFLQEEAAHIHRYIDEANDLLPFKQQNN